jgi:hypothetical protein
MSRSDRELLKVLTKPVDVRRLVDKLSFDLDGLEEASMDQPKLRLKAGRLKVQMMLHKLQLKRKLAALIGKKSIHIRHKHGNNYTATAIKNELGYDHEVREAQRRLDEAEALEEFAQDFREAFKERSMAILNLSRIRSSETSSELRAVKGQAEINDQRKRARKMRDRMEREWEER